LYVVGATLAVSAVLTVLLSRQGARQKATQDSQQSAVAQGHAQSDR